MNEAQQEAERVIKVVLTSSKNKKKQRKQEQKMVKAKEALSRAFEDGANARGVIIAA